MTTKKINTGKNGYGMSESAVNLKNKIDCDKEDLLALLTQYDTVIVSIICLFFIVVGICIGTGYTFVRCSV